MTVDETVERMRRLLDLAAQARREGRGDDVVLFLQEMLALANTLPQRSEPVVV